MASLQKRSWNIFRTQSYVIASLDRQILVESNEAQGEIQIIRYTPLLFPFMQRAAFDRV